jgi:sulfopyruvate decarboxylase alpha subunit
MAAISRRGCRVERYSTPAGRLNRRVAEFGSLPGGKKPVLVAGSGATTQSRSMTRNALELSTMAENDGNSARWQDELYDLLRHHNLTQFAYVPDAGHRILIDRSLADPGVHSVALTTEEEGVALLAGADLGGARGVLLMQSSGVGNCVNMLSLIKGGRFPFLTLISMRGDFGEGNPWQYPMGQAVEPVLQAMGVICLRIERPEDVVPTVGAALTMAFQGGNAVAVLLTQKLLGAKAF